MLRRRLAAVALAALTAALFTMPGMASGAQAGEALVRVAHFAPGLLKGDVYVVYVNGRLQLKGVPFKTVSDYLKVKPGKFKVEVREAGEPADSPPVTRSTAPSPGMAWMSLTLLLLLAGRVRSSVSSAALMEVS